MDKEQRHHLLRDTMIQQESVFKQQVRELHRLYQKQKALMDELRMDKKKTKTESLSTRDFLHTLDLHHHSRSRGVKRVKLLDLEQLPNDDSNNNKEEDCVPTQAENSSLDLREEAYQHWDCEAPSPGDSQTLSLFPIPSRGPSSASAFTSPDSDLKNGIRFCQPFNQDQHWQRNNPWTRGSSLQDDAYGARLLGQILTSCEYQRGEKLAASKFLLGQKDYTAPWQQQQQAYSFNFKSTPPPFFPGFYLDANRVSFTDSLKNSAWWSSAGNPTKAPVQQPNFHAPKHIVKVAGFSAATIPGTLDSHSDRSKPVAVTLPGIEKKIDSLNRSCLGGVTTSAATATTTSACTDRRNTTADRPAHATSPSAVLLTDSPLVNRKQGSGVDLNKDCIDYVDEEEDPTTVLDDPLNIRYGKDTTRWAATMLLSLAPNNGKLQGPSSKQDEATSSLLSWEVKLFKSVVIMLKQEQGGKGSRKQQLVDNQGKAAAATLLETLKAGKIDVREEKPNNSEPSSPGGGGGKSLAAARQAGCNWLWGDVTRRKRMQRHRNSNTNTNHPQPVRCFN